MEAAPTTERRRACGRFSPRPRSRPTRRGSPSSRPSIDPSDEIKKIVDEVAERAGSDLRSSAALLDSAKTCRRRGFTPLSAELNLSGDLLADMRGGPVRRPAAGQCRALLDNSNIGGGSFHGGNDSLLVALCRSGTRYCFWSAAETGYGAQEHAGRGCGGIAEAKLAGHNAWMLTSSALVLFMTAPGLAMFYGGLVRKKNVLERHDAVPVPDGADDGHLGACTATRWRSAATTGALQPVHRQRRLPVHERRRSGRGTTQTECGRRADGRRRFRGSRTCCSRACSSSSRRR